MSGHPLYRALGRSARELQSAYRKLCRHHLERGLVDEIRRATNGGFVVGGERFQKEIAAMVGRSAGAAEGV